MRTFLVDIIILRGFGSGSLFNMLICMAHILTYQDSEAKIRTVMSDL